MKIEQIIQRLGGFSATALLVNRHPSTVREWKKVPVAHAWIIARQLNTTLSEIRPDVWQDYKRNAGSSETT